MDERISPMNQVFVASEWKAMEKNTLRGFVTLELPSGLRIKDVSLHEREQARWISLPAIPWTGMDGKTNYRAVIDFTSEDARRRFQGLALKAIDLLLLGVHT
jgi:hypothetical protein